MKILRKMVLELILIISSIFYFQESFSMTDNDQVISTEIFSKLKEEVIQIYQTLEKFNETTTFDQYLNIVQKLEDFTCKIRADIKKLKGEKEKDFDYTLDKVYSSLILLDEKIQDPSFANTLKDAQNKEEFRKNIDKIFANVKGIFKKAILNSTIKNKTKKEILERLNKLGIKKN